MEIGIAMLLIMVAAIAGVFIGFSNWFDRFMNTIGNAILDKIE